MRASTTAVGSSANQQDLIITRLRSRWTLASTSCRPNSRGRLRALRGATTPDGGNRPRAVTHRVRGADDSQAAMFEFEVI